MLYREQVCIPREQAMAKDKKAKHKSLGKDLKRSIDWLEKFDSVTKVVLGRVEACRHKYSPGHIRTQMDKDGGIAIKGYSGNGVMDIFIRIAPIQERDEIKQEIAKKFG
jgi:hypothetical protein